MESDFTVKDTRLGKSVFANKAFKKGEIILFMEAEIFTWDNAPLDANDENNHYMQIGKDLYMGPNKNADNFLNHSCDPNSAVIIKNKDVRLIALKNIKVGDEITFDYSTTAHEKNHDTWKMECMCNSKNCRKIIRDFIFLPKKTKNKYIKLGIVPDYILNDIPPNN